MDNRYVKIHLLDAPYCIDNEYTYFVPHDLSRFVVRGTFVVVPFGNGNKTQMGIVIEDHCDEPQTKTKNRLNTTLTIPVLDSTIKGNFAFPFARKIAHKKLVSDANGTPKR